MILYLLYRPQRRSPQGLPGTIPKRYTRLRRRRWQRKDGGLPIPRPSGRVDRALCRLDRSPGSVPLTIAMAPETRRVPMAMLVAPTMRIMPPHRRRVRHDVRTRTKTLQTMAVAAMSAPGMATTHATPRLDHHATAFLPMLPIPETGCRTQHLHMAMAAVGTVWRCEMSPRPDHDAGVGTTCRCPQQRAAHDKDRQRQSKSKVHGGIPPAWTPACLQDSTLVAAA